MMRNRREPAAVGSMHRGYILRSQGSHLRPDRDDGQAAMKAPKSEPGFSPDECVADPSSGMTGRGRDRLSHSNYTTGRNSRTRWRRSTSEQRCHAFNGDWRSVESVAGEVRLIGREHLEPIALDPLWRERAIGEHESERVRISVANGERDGAQSSLFDENIPRSLMWPLDEKPAETHERADDDRSTPQPIEDDLRCFERVRHSYPFHVARAFFLSALTPDAIGLSGGASVEVMRIRRQHAEASMRDVSAVEIRRRRGDADVRIGRIAVRGWRSDGWLHDGLRCDRGRYGGRLRWQCRRYEWLRSEGCSRFGLERIDWLGDSLWRPR